jgi:hypothetical protein
MASQLRQRTPPYPVAKGLPGLDSGALGEDSGDIMDYIQWTKKE